MCGPLFSPLALNTVVPPSDMVEETLLADQSPHMVAATAEEGKEGEGVALVTQLPGFMSVPSIAVILMKSSHHSGCKVKFVNTKYWL